jgi:hypothetical protein
MNYFLESIDYPCLSEREKKGVPQQHKFRLLACSFLYLLMFIKNVQASLSSEILFEDNN